VNTKKKERGVGQEEEKLYSAYILSICLQSLQAVAGQQKKSKKKEKERIYI